MVDAFSGNLLEAYLEQSAGKGYLFYNVVYGNFPAAVLVNELDSLLDLAVACCKCCRRNPWDDFDRLQDYVFKYAVR